MPSPGIDNWNLLVYYARTRTHFSSERVRERLQEEGEWVKEWERVCVKERKTRIVQADSLVLNCFYVWTQISVFSTICKKNILNVFKVKSKIVSKIAAKIPAHNSVKIRAQSVAIWVTEERERENEYIRKEEKERKNIFVYAIKKKNQNQSKQISLPALVRRKLVVS